MKFEDEFPKELPEVEDLIRVAYQGPNATIDIVEALVTGRSFHDEGFYVLLAGAGLLLSATLENGALKWQYAEAEDDTDFGPSPRILAVCVLHSPWVEK